MKIEGTTQLLGLVDLLQIAKLNRRSYSIRLTRPGEEGVMAIADGVLRHAAVGRFEGDKAAVRLSAWTDSRIRIEPLSAAPPDTVAHGGYFLLTLAALMADRYDRPAPSPTWRVVGDLELMPASEVLEIFELNSLPVHARFTADRRSASVFLSEGKALHAEMTAGLSAAAAAAMSPEEVIYEVVTWKGTFEAVAAQKLPPPTIETPLCYLIVEGTRLAEERQAADDQRAGEAQEMAAKTIQDLDAGETPDGVRRLVARRYLARGQTAPVETLLKLAQDPDPEVSAEAIRSIYELPIVVLKTVAGDASTPDAVLRHLVEEFWHDDHIMRCLAENPTTSDQTLGALASLASESVLSLITKDAARVARSPAIQAGMNNRGHRALRLKQKQQAERRQKSGGSIHKRILDLPIPDKIFLAYRGSPAERAILAQNPKRMVAEAVLKSPKITDGEIESLASMKSVHVDVLAGIASKPLWINHYPIARAVVMNPKTPAYVSIDLLKRMREVDLKVIEKDRNLPEAVRSSSGRRLQILAKKKGL